MIIHVFNSQQELNQAGAGIITALIQTKPDAVLGLATGGTPVGIYEELVKNYNAARVSFRHAKSFNLDEYVGLPDGHSESYRTYMNHHLFDHVDIQMEETHVPNGNADDVDEECEEYDAMMADAGQVDLQILGIGHNGHIGFNEPGRELTAGTHRVELKAETREANARYFPSIDEVPTHAITMGIASIMKAKQIILIVRGADKAEIVERALFGPITTDCPASLLQAHPNLVVLLDNEAGSGLIEQ
ncbi:glucosamine-6-phosphate deaminase [Paenibacillus sp. N1-5-1-14]|uniref:glucosamine-6-phosphate deaminase n=1 Tax=Paenibacillus radicibacter TaxID=2972488 RepID=UPI00215954E7|nr:glucosamine-6-phosphate deaminase [Paenibacillus radicibacter]MCR8643690.1 glucosamine-6-phosphate deaminase [Paenibacillus radicibacter]